MAKVTIMKKQYDEFTENNLSEEIMKFLPQTVKEIILKLPQSIVTELEEIRIRINRPIIFATNNEQLTYKNGQISKDLKNGYIIDGEEMNKLLHLISQSSIYAWEEEFKRGYLTLKGGHRVGITGKVVLDKGAVRTIKDISGINIRIAKEIKGVADKILPYILNSQQFMEHTLIISPPQCGKTTLLRDIVRQLSNGVSKIRFNGLNVGLVDERSEIAGSFHGIPQYDVGIRTDVLDGCPKAEGMMMLIRSMSPDVIATDEIGAIEDIRALEEVLNSGIKIITTVHGKNLEELKRRPTLKKILDLNIFTRIIILSRSKGVGTIEDILDGYTCKSLKERRI